MKYDGFGRQSRWVFPSKTTPGVADQTDYEEYGYDPNGNRVSLRKRDGGVLGYAYDALNRMVVKVTPGNLANVRYAYDLRGLQTAAWFTGNGWGVGNSYDGFGRLTSSTSNMGGYSRTVSHLYDREGRETELTFPDGQKFWTARDGLGRTGAIHHGALGSSSPFMVGFAWNWASQLYYHARRFGDASVYAYDGPGRITVIEDGFGGGIGNTRSEFQYNPAGQMRNESRTNDSYAHTGSAALTRSYGVNGQNQYTGTVTNGAPGATFAYDPNGNLTSDGTTTFTYDAENRLVSASGAKTAALTYDPLGRLFQVWSPTTGVTQFLYDGDELIAEYNAYGTLLRRYVHGDGSDDPLFWYEGAGFDQPRFPHTNRQGSITATAGPGATPLWINTYDEYGIPGANNQGRFQYTGQAWLPELGMYYYKARFYSARLGRFLQTDPIGYKGGVHLYGYVGNDPINRADPSGLAGCDKSLSPTDCSQAMIIQRSVLQRVQSARADIKHLHEQRRDGKPGLDARAQATQAALKKHFGSSTNSVAQAVDGALGNVATFLRDPGSAAGGRFDYRAPTGDELTVMQSADAMGLRNPFYRPNTVALHIQPGDSQTEILRTFVHEPLHVFGMSRPSLGEQYRGSSSALARVRGGTADAVYNNPDNYACFLYSLGC